MFLDLLQELAEARTEYLRHMALFNQPQREALTQQFFNTEMNYLNLISVAMLRETPVTITFPFSFNSLNSAAYNPVLVTPTQEQIDEELEDYIHPSLQQCSICQDDISSAGVRLRVCQHSFHRSCIQTWFGASVRCPVCRRDIREDPEDQTSSASTEISAQEQNQ
jgi:hypothetical protein